MDVSIGCFMYNKEVMKIMFKIKLWNGKYGNGAKFIVREIQ